jgi:hypothetical protein
MLVAVFNFVHEMNFCERKLKAGLQFWRSTIRCCLSLLEMHGVYVIYIDIDEAVVC